MNTTTQGFGDGNLVLPTVAVVKVATIRPLHPAWKRRD
jgi:hypothetical protein